MKQFMNFFVAGVAVLMALACGTSETSTNGVTLTQGSGSRSYGGRIDKTSVPTASAVRVGAFKDGTLVSEVIPTEGTGTDDHSFTITGLDDGDYTVSVYRVVGTTVDTTVFPPTSEDDRQVLLSAPATVDATTGSSDVVISKTSYQRQINVITTYVVNRIAADTTNNTDVNDVLTELFGSVVASIDSIDVTGGNISSGTNTLTVDDDSISAAIQFMSTAVVATSVMSDSELKTNSSTLSDTITRLSAITAGADLSSALSSYSTLITAANSASSTVTALITAASSFVSEVMDGSITNLTTSLTTSSVSSVQSSSYKVESFGLASGSNLAYGSASGTGGKNFSITTLAPVFELEFVSGNTLTEAQAKALISVEVTNGSETISSMSTLSSLIDVVPADASGTSNKFYLLIKKDYSSSDPALEPGTTYTYTISANSSNSKSVSFGGATSQTGTITTTDVTLTRPYTGSEIASVNLAGNATHSGVSSSSDLEFRLDAKNGVVVDQTDSVGYGIIGSGSDLNVSIYKDGATTATATDSNIQASDVTFVTSETTSSVSSGTLTLSSAVLEAGSTYKVEISNEDGMTDGSGASITSYPTVLYIETAAAQ